MFKAIIVAGDKTLKAEGKTAEEAINKLKPPLFKTKATITLKSGEKTADKLLMIPHQLRYFKYPNSTVSKLARKFLAEELSLKMK